ncbi:MAG: GspE/PulE family protein [Pseudomonadota bacterium]
MDQVVEGSSLARELGETLLASGLLDESALDRALRAEERTGERFDTVLVRLGLVSEADLTNALAEHLRIARALPADIPLEPVLADELQAPFLRANGLLPLAATDAELTLAVTDPFNLEGVRAISYLVEREVVRKIMTPAEFEQAVKALYDAEAGEGGGGEDGGALGDALDDDVERLRDIASEAPIVRLVNQLIAEAVERRASDIHIEPLEDSVTVRFRVDGVLTVSRVLQPTMRAAITSRVKIMAKLNIAERRLPQDGRFKIAVRGMEIDLRVSTTPTLFGESVVMRILDRGRVELDFASLGFEGDVLAEFKAQLAQPHGIILVTGPTGSGKTTTLYTSLRSLNSTERKIFTVEDPVEYHLAGMNQMQVKPSIGLDFARALRSILRQDPDIVMIGEIRDLETVQIAIQASLTGHLVFSTLHTNSAAASITRLLDMGVEDYLAASTVTGILAQRLVRTLCPQCAEPVSPPAEYLEKITRNAPNITMNVSPKLCRPVGCDACQGSGYAGRTTIFELLKLTEKICSLVLSNASEREIELAAISEGMRTLYTCGVEKALRGETTIDEVLRVSRMM